MSRARKGLQDLVSRAAAEPAYMASAIADFARLEHVEVEQVLAGLGVRDANRDYFLLSLRPSGERFAEMMRAVSTRFLLDESVLLSLLREVEALSAFTGRGVSVVDSGALMAARARPKPKTGKGKKGTSKRRIRNKRKGDGSNSDRERDDDAS